MHGRFLLFNPANLSVNGSLMEVASELSELRRSSNRVDLYPAVIFVSDPAAQTKGGGLFLNEPSESDALDTSVNEPPARLLRGISHRTSARSETF